jgi:hypothetical protein
MDLLAIDLPDTGTRPHLVLYLGQTTRVQVMAEYRLTHESPEDRKNRQDRIKRARMEWL